MDLLQQRGGRTLVLVLTMTLRFHCVYLYDNLTMSIICLYASDLLLKYIIMWPLKQLILVDMTAALGNLLH